MRRTCSRFAGPWMLSIAWSACSRPSTAAPTALRPASRSSRPNATPSARTRSTSRAELGPGRQGAIGEALVGLGAEALERQRAEGQQELPGDRRVRDAGPAELCPARDVRRAGDEVDRERLRAPGDRQRRGLPRLRDEALEVRPRDRPHVEAGEDGVRVGDQAQAEAVARRRLVAIDEAPGHERAEQARDRALVDVGALRELAHAGPGRQLGERVEQRERTVDGLERSAFLSHRTRHVATHHLSVKVSPLSATLLPIGQHTIKAPPCPIS